MYFNYFAPIFSIFRASTSLIGSICFPFEDPITAPIRVFGYFSRLRLPPGPVCHYSQQFPLFRYALSARPRYPERFRERENQRGLVEIVRYAFPTSLSAFSNSRPRIDLPNLIKYQSERTDFDSIFSSRYETKVLQSRGCRYKLISMNSFFVETILRFGFNFPDLYETKALDTNLYDTNSNREFAYKLIPMNLSS